MEELLDYENGKKGIRHTRDAFRHFSWATVFLALSSLQATMFSWYLRSFPESVKHSFYSYADGLRKVITVVFIWFTLRCIYAAILAIAADEPWQPRKVIVVIGGGLYLLRILLIGWTTIGAI